MRHAPPTVAGRRTVQLAMLSELSPAGPRTAHPVWRHPCRAWTSTSPIPPRPA